MFRFYLTIIILFFSAGAGPADSAAVSAQQETAVFAGGCFWCMEPPFEKIDGVIRVLSGYTGGKGEDPTYKDYGRKGHMEAVEILYDPSRVTYTQLLDVFWRQVNPTDSGGQFCDRGPEYRPAIFYLNKDQELLARQSRDQFEKSRKFGRTITLELIPASKFYPAEEYHQDYYKKNPLRYKYYRFRCGRDQYLERIWRKKNQ
ncbi:MAG: peptide-methionine (S)-S-oxide reductase MsrA [Candidatus Omnitrophota bacterium]